MIGERDQEYSQESLGKIGPDDVIASLKGTSANKAPAICHVLIIENETLVAMDIQSLLRQAGGTSFAFAATEEDAVTQAQARCPLIMTSDGRLRTGTGPAAVRIIRDRLGMIPVLFISGTPEDCIPREPGDPVFGKPFDHAAIVATLRAMLSAAVAPRSRRLRGTP